MTALALVAPARKVRASPGKVQDNVLSGRPEGKCHRNKPPAACLGIPRRRMGKGEIAR